MTIPQDSYSKVAEVLKDKLGRKAFVTVERREITEILREVTGLPNTRVKVLVSQAIMDALNEIGLTTYPHLYDVGAHDSLRVLRSDSFLVELVELLNHPNEETDQKLRVALRGANSKVSAEAEPVPA